MFKMNDPILLEFCRVRKQFGPVIALNDVSFSVRAGEVHCLVGENGAGKSTLIRCINLLERPDEGTVRVTFDMNVRAAVGSFDIFDATLPVLPVLEPGKLVMEVKFTEFCPQLVRDLVPPGAAELTAVSKYCLCYEKTAYLRGFNYWESDFENRGDI